MLMSLSTPLCGAKHCTDTAEFRRAKVPSLRNSCIWSAASRATAPSVARRGRQDLPTGLPRRLVASSLGGPCPGAGARALGHRKASVLADRSRLPRRPMSHHQRHRPPKSCSDPPHRPECLAIELEKDLPKLQTTPRRMGRCLSSRTLDSCAIALLVRGASMCTHFLALLAACTLFWFWNHDSLVG